MNAYAKHICDVLLLVGSIVMGLTANLALANCETHLALKGVNLAGAEFNSAKLPGVLNKDYIYPTPAEIDYFASAGANTIRLPFRWERIQPTLLGALDPGELQQLNTVVAKTKARALCLILDVHNYGTYRGKAIGTSDVPSEAFVDLWTRLAVEFGTNATVAFGLMNEPHKLKIDQWAELAQQTVYAIRKVGSRNLILVSGGRWSGIHDWENQRGGISNAAAFAHFKDPQKRAVIEVHQYADANFSGTGQTCQPAGRFIEMFDKMTRWARVNNQKLFLGEFGAPPNPLCLETLATSLEQMKDETIWRGWTYWAAGRWWGGYPMSIAPKNDEDAPQMKILKRYL